MITIRKAVEDNLDALIALDTYAHDHAERAQDIRNWIALGQCHAALLDGEMAGYSVLNHSFFHQAFIEMLMIGMAFRRCGLGRALIDHACVAFPGEKVWTSTGQSNAAMQALLLSAGFQRSGMIEYLDPETPELIFVHLPETASAAARESV